MKEASGEFSMTLVVIIAAIGIIGIIGWATGEDGFLREWIETQWGGISVDEYE